MQIEYDLLARLIKSDASECPISMDDSIGKHVYRINGTDADVIFLETAPRWSTKDLEMGEQTSGWCEILSIMPKRARTDDIIRLIMTYGELEGGL